VTAPQKIRKIAKALINAKAAEKEARLTLIEAEAYRARTKELYDEACKKEAVIWQKHDFAKNVCSELSKEYWNTRNELLKRNTP
jgi:hypothetical protein